MSEQHMGSPELTVYGIVYESHGVKYLHTPNCHIGIRVDRVKAFTGIVAKAETQPSGWVKVTLEVGDEFCIHEDWIQIYGWLNPGDKVGGILDIGDPNRIKAWYVRRVAKEAVADE